MPDPARASWTRPGCAALACQSPRAWAGIQRAWGTAAPPATGLGAPNSRARQARGGSRRNRSGRPLRAGPRPNSGGQSKGRGNSSPKRPGRSSGAACPLQSPAISPRRPGLPRTARRPMAGVQAAKPGGRGPEGSKDNSITARGRRPMRTQGAALHCRDRAGQIRAWCVGRPAAPGSGSSSGSTARPRVRSNPAGRRPCAPALFAACACQPLVACPSASPHHDDGIMTTSGSALPPIPNARIIRPPRDGRGQRARTTLERLAAGPAYGRGPAPAAPPARTGLLPYQR